MHHGGPQWTILGPGLVCLAVGYLAAIAAVNRRGRGWPAWRTASWCAGLACASAAGTGPLAAAAHHDFTAHMTGHLLLGMAAPLLLVLGAPVTLALRALPARPARTLSHLLNSRPARLLTHPVTAAILNAGGLWALYTTSLYQQMAHHTWLHQLMHAHVLVAGYLFTAAIIGADPAPHRPGPRVRAAVLVAFLAAHGILAKHLYAHPPPGVPQAHAEAGAQLMYYGGDVLDLVLIAIFCWQWYAATAPGPAARPPSSSAPGENRARLGMPPGGRWDRWRIARM
jgi:putative membrane protein